MNHTLAELRRQLDSAESRLNLKRDARPSPWPTAQEILDWETSCKKLEEALESARAEVRAANVRRGELTRELILARNNLSSLMFRERNMHPRETEPYKATELSGVR
jgi:hypothetical protein